MSLKFGAITPHPPILIPAIGKENLEHLKDTIESFKHLNQKIIDEKIDTLIIISPHGPIKEEKFTINSNQNFEVDFEEFGDFATKLSFQGDTEIIKKIKAEQNKEMPIQFINEEKIDHGCGVPLFYLNQNTPGIKIVPVYFTTSSLEDHLEFGNFLNKIIAKSENKIAVIASGDLSHRLDKNAPAGYSAKGKKFDNKLIELLKNKKTEEILNMSENLINEAGECGLRSITIMLGMLDNLDYETKILSYEGPFGVGYLVADFDIKKGG